MSAGPTAVIVEDEPHAVRRLSMALRSIADLTVLGVARDGDEGLALIRRMDPDIAFLDISLPGLSGLEVAEALNGGRTSVVFVTAYDRHAIDAFRLAAVDYLLKPVEFPQVVEAVERARRRGAEDRKGAGGEVAALLEAMRRAGLEPQAPTPEYDAEMWVAGRRGAVRLALTSVEWFEAERDYVRIHADGGEHLIRQAVHALEDRLDPKRFLRVHRSAVVNVDRIERVERKVNGALTIRLASGHRVPVGRSYADAVRALISGASVGAGRAPRRS